MLQLADTNFDSMKVKPADLESGREDMSHGIDVTFKVNDV